MKEGKDKKISPSKEISYAAVMCALLIGGQYVFSFVAGVEIVTLLLVCYSAVFGARRGAICAAAFSVLRCFIFGFYPTVIVLYIIYYPLLAAVFGVLGRLDSSAFEKLPAAVAVAINLLLISLAAACVAAYALDLIKLSRIYKVTIYVFLWVIFSLCVALCIAFDILLAAQKKSVGRFSELLRLITFTCVAAVCTIIFSLLDDVITPLMLGFTPLHALGYFYSSFTAMLPQTVCTVVTVGALFLPVTAVFKKLN